MIRYVPTETVDIADCEAPASGERCSCGKCDKTFSGGAIVSKYAGLNTYEESHQARRFFFCDHCEHIVTWLETIEPLNRDDIDIAIAIGKGEPPIEMFRFTGMVLSGPGYICGRRAMELFLARHPETRGVIGAVGARTGRRA